VILFRKIKTYCRLGIANIVRVALYRLGLRTGLHSVIKVKADIGGALFFAPPLQTDKSFKVSGRWGDESCYFGWYQTELNGGFPVWHSNPFNGTAINSSELGWWKLSDFSLNVGDIKTVWEASRFDWVLVFAQRSKVGDVAAIKALNSWLTDWCQKNAAYTGPNWKCGQEASIRVLHLAMAARVLDQREMCDDLARLVSAHLLRIYPTVSYAIAQDNNHGTSEAAALFIGGLWCERHGIPQGKKWKQAGRSLLENRIKRLILPDGSFSQYSVNYHRVLIDTLSMVEVWRNWYGSEKFSSLFYERAQKATDWLFTMVEPANGDAPNLGGNDGARLLPITDTDFRDFRPSVQLAMALFVGKKAYTSKRLFDDKLRWLGVAEPKSCATGQLLSRQFDDGGYAVLKHSGKMVLLKYPRYKFRPRHCDALHVDFWLGSENVLRDGGSYSYNAESRWQKYFTGTESHNTIEFDGRDQMPLLSRFLRGEWLTARNVVFKSEGDASPIASAGYCDWKGACHHRKVELNSHSLLIVDTVKNFSRKAVLRWRLQSGNWQLGGNSVASKDCKIVVSADVPIIRVELIEGWESRYYYKKTPLPVLEVEIQSSGKIVTELTF